MKLSIKESSLKGEIKIPGSKSHAIRALVFATLAEGTSRIRGMLSSDDTDACLAGCKAFGAKICGSGNGGLEVQGFAGKPRTPKSEVNLKESGTSMSMIVGVAAHAKGPSVLTGGDTLRQRPFAPHCKGLVDLGAKVESFENSGRPPLKVSGFLEGGSTEIDGINSQPVSSLLINCALAENDSEINVVNPMETPYIEMTMQWLDEFGIKYTSSKDFTHYTVEGKQQYHAFEKPVPADWSSACFPMCAAAVTPDSSVLLTGLNLNDSQGDKEVLNLLNAMGADIEVKAGGIQVNYSELEGRELDWNATPDALPILAVVGCLAEGETRLVNVSHARIKETDRIAAMAKELKKLGANVEEKEDALIVRKSVLKGALVNGYNDHRTIMALAVAGLNAKGVTEITTSEGISKTYPSFVGDFRKLGAKMELL